MCKISFVDAFFNHFNHVANHESIHKATLMPYFLYFLIYCFLRNNFRSVKKPSQIPLFYLARVSVFKHFIFKEFNKRGVLVCQPIVIYGLYKVQKLIFIISTKFVIFLDKKQGIFTYLYNILILWDILLFILFKIPIRSMSKKQHLDPSKLKKEINIH